MARWRREGVGLPNGAEVSGLELSPAPPGCLRCPLARDGVAATVLAGRRRTYFCPTLQLPLRLFQAGSREGRLEAWIRPTQSAKMLREGCEKAALGYSKAG